MHTHEYTREAEPESENTCQGCGDPGFEWELADGFWCCDCVPRFPMRVPQEWLIED